MESGCTCFFINAERVLAVVSPVTKAFIKKSRCIIPTTGVLSLWERPCECATFLFQWRFLFLPPTSVLSISTSSIRGFSLARYIWLLILCNMNHAVFWVTSISFANWYEEIPALWLTTIHIATNHLCRSILVFSNMVPVLTVKFFPVFLQR